MNVLSLFDGLSGGSLALQKANIKVNTYIASEIDKYAIQVANHNFPNILHVGDITKLSYSNGKLYADGNVVFTGTIDLIIGGSPCQGFSFAGGQLAFDDPRSKLFFEYTRLLKETNAKYFLLENVKMRKESEDVITKCLGVTPIVINSSLVSAQNRVRLYWTNIPNVTQPKDLNIMLADIIEGGYADRDKSYCKSRRQLVFDRPCTTKDFKNTSLCHHVANATDINGNESIKRVYATSGKAPTLTTMQGGHREPKVSYDGVKYRKLTPLECERLQTIPDNYTLVVDANGKQLVSNSQRYKMIGNGWTIDVISHILKGLNAVPRV